MAGPSGVVFISHFETVGAPSLRLCKGGNDAADTMVCYARRLASHVRRTSPALYHLFLLTAFAAQNAPYETLLDDLHHRRRRAAFGFADQQMNVLGHDDVSHDHELVAPADLL